MRITPYPLVLEPSFKARTWGGTRWRSALGKEPPSGTAGPIGESWELVDLEAESSRVARGPAAGRTLQELLERWGAELSGHVTLEERRFPLLIKYLDAAEPLSIQVHPTPDFARQKGGFARPKSEAWIILEAGPQGCLYRGLREPMDRERLRSLAMSGDLVRFMHRIPVKKGQAYYLPSGTIHALGGDVLVAEIQTPSDTTYRLFDWNRVDRATGVPRTLHIDEGVECALLDVDFAPHEQRSHVASVWTAVTRLITSPHFNVEKVRMVEGVEQQIPYAEPVVWMMLSGTGRIACEGLKEPIEFSRGETLLLPAGLKNATIRTHEVTSWLEVTLPVPSDLAGFARPEERELRQLMSDSMPYVTLGLPGGGHA